MPRRSIKPDDGGLLGKPAVAGLLACSVPTLDRMRKADKSFPRPVWLGPVTPRWRRSEIESWLSKRPKTLLAPAWDAGERQRQNIASNRKRKRITRRESKQ
jgi:predicted DNA-binding transcriptional regulator AlpA